MNEYINYFPAYDDYPAMVWVGTVPTEKITFSMVEFLDYMTTELGPISFPRDGADDGVWIDRSFIESLHREFHLLLEPAIEAGRDVFNAL